ncbi:hypothetical protein OL548_13810 [Lysinibacillus sp. MHQ-1]|nr:hypothetical protein OL548_13810 [Lysinibacillus sp. MHQ-1]
MSLFGLSDAEGAAMWSSSLEEIYFTNCPSFEGSLKNAASFSLSWS